MNKRIIKYIFSNDINVNERIKKAIYRNVLNSSVNSIVKNLNYWFDSYSLNINKEYESIFIYSVSMRLVNEFKDSSYIVGFLENNLRYCVCLNRIALNCFFITLDEDYLSLTVDMIRYKDVLSLFITQDYYDLDNNHLKKVLIKILSTFNNSEDFYDDNMVRCIFKNNEFLKCLLHFHITDTNIKQLISYSENLMPSYVNTLRMFLNEKIV